MRCDGVSNRYSVYGWHFVVIKILIVDIDVAICFALSWVYMQ